MNSLKGLSGLVLMHGHYGWTILTALNRKRLVHEPPRYFV